jgi:hypothetical protein
MSAMWYLLKIAAPSVFSGVIGKTRERFQYKN